ncbi:hypothetical protein O3P69_008253 [Scylla paramamosain]|uniref:Galactosylgalactosylxylosylprotein 3-beta-glucuronosyltransferase n=1 Tax=Scylla paramamosain TaxID=85552 RepID=A0AAW0T1Z8_SCYPA
MGSLNLYILKRRIRKWWKYLVVLIFLLAVYFGGFFHITGNISTTPPSEHSRNTMKEVFALRRQIRLLKSVLKQYSIPEKEYSDVLLPVIYVITPTYTRPQQKAELTRLKSVFLHVPALHWIVVEDAPKKSQMVSNFLESSGLTHTHLHQSTPQEWKLKDSDPKWRKPRGVLQRNAGIRWLRSKFAHDANPRGVVYFADDDNTYSVELFHEMRDTHKVSVWPVALVGGVLVERPLVGSNGQVSSWLAGWKADRPFAMDMAGFAVNLSLLLNKSGVEFSIDAPIGFQESVFLEKLITQEELEPKADLCTKVYVWHTRTEQPDLKQEIRLNKVGKHTDEGIEL